MNLYEVIRWGNDLEDALLGGPDGPDTCFLVRANSPDQAGEMADRELASLAVGRTRAHAAAIYLLGVDAGTEAIARVLRGPYIQHAYRHGWRQWSRDRPGAAWMESEPSD